MIYIVSLQYSPVFKSLCFALGNQLEEKGMKVKYILSSHYEWMVSKNRNIKFIGNSKDIATILHDSINYRNFNRIKKLVLTDKPQWVYFFNIHPFFNNYIARLVNKYGGTVIQHIHEPYVENKNHYGTFQKRWLYLFEYIQGNILKKCDVVILSSQEACGLFNKRYSGFKGKKIIIPLLYEDLGKDLIHSERKYLNFIGPPVTAKNPEKFLEIVSNSRSMGFNFLIISREKINDKKYYQYDNLEVFQNEKISDNSLGNFMKKSILTITPYKTARQSAVVATAFMYGTPVLATNIGGLNESIIHKKTGYLVDIDSDISEWVNGLVYIKNNIKRLSKDSRDFFEKNYSEINWPKYFKEVFEISD